jgi:hypothetical protein
MFIVSNITWSLAIYIYTFPDYGLITVLLVHGKNHPFTTSRGNKKLDC